jgi:thiosulfate dehydrogenase
MKRIWLMAFAATLSIGGTVMAQSLPTTGTITIDLTQWSPPDIAKIGDDPFEQLVKYGHALFTDTANEIGPTVPGPAMRFSGNNLACKNCHLQAGAQPYAMPLIGVWGQFPQYRARQGAVEMLQNRINGCMRRSMNGQVLPFESREMVALSSYMRWLSAGVPDGAKLIGAGTLRSWNPNGPPIPAMARRSMPKAARHVTELTVSVSARRAGRAIKFRRSGVPTASTTAPA